jgi:hypothetical protein
VQCALTVPVVGNQRASNGQTMAAAASDHNPAYTCGSGLKHLLYAGLLAQHSLLPAIVMPAAMTVQALHAPVHSRGRMEVKSCGCSIWIRLDIWHALYMWCSLEAGELLKLMDQQPCAAGWWQMNPSTVGSKISWGAYLVLALRDCTRWLEQLAWVVLLLLLLLLLLLPLLLPLLLLLPGTCKHFGLCFCKAGTQQSCGQPRCGIYDHDRGHTTLSLFGV